MTTLKTMFQRSVLTYWCMWSLDRLSVGPIPWRSVISVGEESQPLDLCTGLLGYLFTVPPLSRRRVPDLQWSAPRAWSWHVPAVAAHGFARPAFISPTASTGCDQNSGIKCLPFLTAASRYHRVLFHLFLVELFQAETSTFRIASPFKTEKMLS